MLAQKPNLALVILLAACGKPGSGTSEGDSAVPGTGSGTDTGSATDAPTTGGTDTGSTSGTTTETNATGGTATTTGAATDTDALAGEACRAWYRTQTEIFRWYCECDVENGFSESVELCLMEYPDHEACSCQIFEAAAETAELLECYDAVDQITVACLKGEGLCGNPQQCFDTQAQGYVSCGKVPARVCGPLYETCDDVGPLAQCAGLGT
jgi:hypothetical protein